MAALLKEKSTITAKGQTTAPKAVRQALGVDYGGRITFVVPVSATLRDRVAALVGDIDVDLDAEIDGTVTL
jgi:antitoxin PrlF